MKPDAILYLISQQHLSAGRQRLLADLLCASTLLPSRLVRLEGTGPHLSQGLDALTADKHRIILVQPVGLPFSQSLAAWLPGALAHWLAAHDNLGLTLLLADDQSDNAKLLHTLAAHAISDAPGSQRIDPAKASLGKLGWQNPPPFKHHILVCTGPRCHFRDAPNLHLALSEALAKAGRTADCLLATTGCLYPCNQGPLLALYPRGEWYRLPDDAAVERFVHRVIGDGQTLPDLLVHKVHSQPANSGPDTSAFHQRRN